MECQFPPPLTEDDLTAAFYGVADESITAHLAGCPYCKERMAAVQRFDVLFGSLLKEYRWNCPPAQQLAEYIADLLPPETQQAVREHLADCAACQEDEAALRAALQDEDKLGRDAASSAQQRHSPRQMIAVVGEISAEAMRGRGSTQPRKQATVQNITIYFELNHEANGLMLTGEVVEVNAFAPDAWAGALLELRQNDRLVQVTQLDELGEFKCGPIEAVSSDLRITTSEGRSIVVRDLTLP